MLPDITVTERAQESVGQRVKPHVRVGMPRQRLAMREVHAEQPDRFAWPESMHVESLTSPRQAFTQQTLGPRKVARLGHFQIGGIPRHHPDDMSGGLHQRGIVGGGPFAGSRPVRPQDHLE